MPLRNEGVGRFKAFLLGSLSGIVEPIFGILVVLVAGGIPAFRCLAIKLCTGAMMYVVVEELIPEAHLGEHLQCRYIGRDGWFFDYDDIRCGIGMRCL